MESKWWLTTTMMYILAYKKWKDNVRCTSHEYVIVTSEEPKESTAILQTIMCVLGQIMLSASSVQVLKNFLQYSKISWIQMTAGSYKFDFSVLLAE